MPTVWNKNYSYPEDAVYVGRGSPFGNPYIAFNRDSTFPDVIRVRDPIAEFEKYIAARPALIKRIRAELKGKDLLCYCAPRACHADILLRIANEET